MNDEMKICLIGPPTITEFSESQVADSEAIRLIADHAPLGILMLAAVLERFGIRSSILDLNQTYYDYIKANADDRGDFCEYVGRLLDSQQFDVFGFSTICSSYPLTLRLASRVKESHSGAQIILGGPQASVVDRQTLSAFSAIDLIVRGEAEETLPEVLSSFASGKSLASIPGVTFRQADTIVRNPNAPPIADLDSLPMPAFHLYPYLKSASYLPLEIGRGCPFACSFCSTNDFFRRQFRLKSAAKMFEQMKLLSQTYGLRTFDLIHDMFTINRKKVVEFCETLKGSGEQFYWSCSARTDCIDDELIDLMAQAGCQGVFFGIDSGSDFIQQVMNKRLNLSEAVQRIERTCEQQIKTTVSLITGFPEETKENLRDTVSFIGDCLRFDKAEPQLHLLAPLAETPITTKYQDSLTFDDIISDQSYQGWQQEVPDRDIIRSWPKIFTSFYAVPTQWLDRRYLMELREFILSGTRRFRWLFLGLHQECGDLLSVFDEWKSWYVANLGTDVFRGSSVREYYFGDRFGEDFYKFVSSWYVPKFARQPIAISAIADYHIAGERACAAQKQRVQQQATYVQPNVPLQRESKPIRANGISLTRSPVDLGALLNWLRKGKLNKLAGGPVTLVFRPVSDQVQVIQLDEHTGQLLGLCDGNRTVAEIIDDFTRSRHFLLGVSPEKCCLFGLGLLQKRQLIEVSEV